MQGPMLFCVSNHGGRQLDSVRSSITALPDIAEALEGRATVMIEAVW